MDLRPDVLIVGAGICGTSLAVALQERGLSVVLAERDSQVRERFKGEYLQPVAVQRLHRLGMGAVLQELLDTGKATAIRELRFRDLASEKGLSQWFSRALSRDLKCDLLVRYPGDTYGVSISQQDLTHCLRKIARARLGQSFLEGVDLRLTSRDFNRPCFLGRGFRVRPRLVIGADGRNSSVRLWIGGAKAPASGKPVLGAEPEFIVGADFESSARLPHRYEVLRTDGEGTFSFFQLGEDRQRLYWNTQDSSSGKQGWRERITELLDSTIQKHLGQSASVGAMSGAPANTAWVGPAGRGRFLLAGDALAVTTPLGGQGMAFVLEHAERLVSEIPSVFVGSGVQKRVSTLKWARILKSHHSASRRYFHHINLMNLFLYHLCFSRSSLARGLSRTVFSHWNSHPETRELVAEYFAGIRVTGLSPLRIAELLGVPGTMKVSALLASRVRA